MRAARGGVHLHIFVAAVEHHVKVIVVAGPDKDAGLTSGQAVGRIAGAFKRLPGCFQHHTLLRVHGRRFAWSNAEELGVKFVDAIDKAAPERSQFTGGLGIGIIKRITIPA